MKAVLSAVVLSLFFSVSQASIKATDAVSNLISSGTHQGRSENQSCQVIIEKNQDSVVVAVIENESQKAIALLDTASNYSVNPQTGEISASESLKYPHFLKGGTQIVNIKKISSEQVQVSFAHILLDHKGNDASSFVTCTVFTK